MTDRSFARRGEVLDIVTQIPASLGHFPHESVVLVGVAHTAGGGFETSGPAIRLDLEHGTDLAAAVAAAVRVLDRGRARGALVVTFSQSPELAAAVRAEYVPALELLVGPGRVRGWHVDNVEGRCVPPCGDGPCVVPLDRFTLDDEVGQTPPALAVPACDPVDAADARAAAARWAHTWLVVPQAFVLEGFVGVWQTALNDVGAGRTLSAAALGRLMHTLARREQHSLVLHELVEFLSGPVPERAGALEVLVSRHPDVARLPDVELSAAVVDLLRAVAAHAQGGARVGACALASAVAWWVGGRSEQAQVLAGQALDLDNAYALAHLVATADASARPPGWVMTPLG